MRFTNKFPYTNINNINLDWIIKRVKELGETVRSYANDIANAVALAEAAQEAADSVTGTAESAVATAQAAEATANAIAGTANSALSTAQAANTTAQAAEATANAIAGTANSALSTAQAANTTAQAANVTAQAAEESADNAEIIAGAASANASNAVQTANTALATAQSALTIASQFDESALNEKAGSLVDTETGAIVTFLPDRTIQKLLNVSVAVMPLQAGSGTPAPDNVRPISGWSSVDIYETGVNLLQPTQAGTSGTTNGITWVVNADGTVTASGVATGIANVTVCNTQVSMLPFAFNGGALTISTSPTISGVTAQADVYANGVYQRTLTSSQPTSTFDAGNITIDMRYRIESGTTIPTGTVLHPQIEIGSSATAFKPYTSNQYTITLGNTVYGGALNAANGTITVEWGLYTYNGTEDGWNANQASQYGVSYFRNTGFYNEWTAAILPSEAVVNNFFKSNIGLLHDYKWIDGNAVTPGQYGLAIGYGLRAAINGLTPDNITLEEWKTWLSSNPIQLVAKLKNPITITLDPVTFATISGQTNNVWSNAGNVSVEFAADLKWYIDKEIVEVQALALENGG